MPVKINASVTIAFTLWCAVSLAVDSVVAAADRHCADVAVRGFPQFQLVTQPLPAGFWTSYKDVGIDGTYSTVSATPGNARSTDEVGPISFATLVPVTRRSYSRVAPRFGTATYIWYCELVWKWIVTLEPPTVNNQCNENLILAEFIEQTAGVSIAELVGAGRTMLAGGNSEATRGTWRLRYPDLVAAASRTTRIVPTGRERVGKVAVLADNGRNETRRNSVTVMCRGDTSNCGCGALKVESPRYNAFVAAFEQPGVTERRPSQLDSDFLPDPTSRSRRRLLDRIAPGANLPFAFRFSSQGSGTLAFSASTGGADVNGGRGADSPLLFPLSGPFGDNVRNAPPPSQLMLYHHGLLRRWVVGRAPAKVWANRGAIGRRRVERAVELEVPILLDAVFHPTTSEFVVLHPSEIVDRDRNGVDDRLAALREIIEDDVIVAIGNATFSGAGVGGEIAWETAIERWSLTQIDSLERLLTPQKFSYAFYHASEVLSAVTNSTTSITSLPSTLLSRMRFACLPLSHCTTQTETVSIDVPHLPRYMFAVNAHPLLPGLNQSRMLRIVPSRLSQPRIGGGFVYELSDGADLLGMVTMLHAVPEVAFNLTFSRPSNLVLMATLRTLMSGNLTRREGATIRFLNVALDAASGAFTTLDLWRQVTTEWMAFRAPSATTLSEQLQGRSVSPFATAVFASAIAFDGHNRPWGTMGNSTFRFRIEKLESQLQIAESDLPLDAINGEERAVVQGIDMGVVTHALVATQNTRLEFTIEAAVPPVALEDDWENDVVSTFASPAELLVVVPPISGASAALRGGPCGCAALEVDGVTITDVVVPRCNATNVLRVLFTSFPFRKQASFTGNSTTVVTLSLIRTCPAASADSVLPLAAAAVVLRRYEQRNSTCRRQQPVVGCSCSNAADGAWCGYRRSCHLNVCEGCSHYRAAEHRTAAREAAEVVQPLASSLSGDADTVLAATDRRAWRYFLGFCYKVMPDVVSWRDAEDVCRGIGATLPSVRSEAEAAFIARVAADTEVSRAWLAGTEVPSQSTATATAFGWINGLPFQAPAAAWAGGIGRPNETAVQRIRASLRQKACVTVRADVSETTLGVLDVDACDVFHGVVCQRMICSELNQFPIVPSSAPTASARFAVGSTPSNRLISPSNFSAISSAPADFGDSVSMGVGEIETYFAPLFDTISFCAIVDDARPCNATSGEYAPEQLSLFFSLAASAGGPNQFPSTQWDWRFSSSVRAPCPTISLNGATGAQFEVFRVVNVRDDCEYVDIVHPQLCRWRQFGELSCQRGYLALSSGRCVKLMDALPFSDAVAMCRAAGAALATVSGKEMSEVLFSWAIFESFWAGAQFGLASGVSWRNQDASAEFVYPARMNVVVATVDHCLTSLGRALASAPCSAPRAFFCETVMTMTMTDSVDPSASQQVTLTVTTEASQTQGLPSPTATFAISPSVSATVTASEATQSVTGSLPLTVTSTVTETATPELVPGTMRLLTADTIQQSDIANDGVTVRLKLENDGFRPGELVLGETFLLTSTLWRDHWGEGVAHLTATRTEEFASFVVSPDSVTFSITFGPFPRFRFRHDEELSFDFAPLAFRKGVRPSGLPIRIRVPGNEGCGMQCMLLTVLRYMTLAIVVLNFISGGDFSFFYEYVTGVLLLEADCNAESQPLPVVLHPIYVPIGSDPWRFSFSAAASNGSILLGLLILHWAFTARLVMGKHQSLRAACAQASFPNLLYFPFVFLSPGLMVGVTALFAFGVWWQKLLAAGALLIFLAFVALFSPVVRESSFASRFIRRVHFPDATSEDERAMLYRDRSLAARLYDAFAASGAWDNSDKELTFVYCYRWSFTDYAAPHEWFGLYSLGIAVSVGVIQSVQTFDFSSCVVESGCIVVLMLIHVCMIGFLRPFRRSFHSAASLVVSALQLVGVVFHIATQYQPVQQPVAVAFHALAFIVLDAFVLAWLCLRAGQALGCIRSFPAIPVPPVFPPRAAVSAISANMQSGGGERLRMLLGDYSKTASEHEETISYGGRSTLMSDENFSFGSATSRSAMMAAASEEIRREKDAQLARERSGLATPGGGGLLRMASSENLRLLNIGSARSVSPLSDTSIGSQPRSPAMKPVAPPASFLTAIQASGRRGSVPSAQGTPLLQLAVLGESGRLAERETSHHLHVDGGDDGVAAFRAREEKLRIAKDTLERISRAKRETEEMRRLAGAPDHRDFHRHPGYIPPTGMLTDVTDIRATQTAFSTALQRRKTEDLPSFKKLQTTVIAPRRKPTTDELLEVSHFWNAVGFDDGLAGDAAFMTSERPRDAVTIRSQRDLDNKGDGAHEVSHSVASSPSPRPSRGDGDFREVVVHDSPVRSESRLVGFTSRFGNNPLAFPIPPSDQSQPAAAPKQLLNPFDWL